MDFDLAGKTAIVTGASRGIGLAIVRTLIGEGVMVVGASRTITPDLKESGAVALSADLSTAGGVADFMEVALSEVDGLDLLVNNVGGGDDLNPLGFLETTDLNWTRVFDINLFSAIRVTRAALPSLIERKGAVLNISSVTARMPGAAPPPYAASKAALTALGKGLAEEFGPLGVRVNTISPGPVRTPLWDADNFGGRIASVTGRDCADHLELMPQEFNLTTGRIAEPQEIADLAVFLLSNRAASICGADYIIDGGMIKTT